MNEHSAIQWDESEGLICAWDLDRKGSGRPLQWADLEQPIASDGLRWIHLDFSKPKGKEWLQKHSGISPTVLDAMLDDDIRPRALHTPHGVLAILRGVNLNPGEDAEDMVSIRIWLEPNRIITTRRRRVMSVQKLQQELAEGVGPDSAGSFIAELAWLLGERIADVVDRLDDSIESAEIAIADRATPARRSEFAELRRKTAHFRRYLGPQREALDRLSRMQHSIFSDAESAALSEEANRMTLFLEELDLARERAMVAQEELLSSLAQEQNSKMYLLAMVSAIFLPLSFLTGLFGMNVAGLPGLENPAAFNWLMVMMMMIGGGILLLFRWKKWL
ncbi:MAG TPA: CorA family divalent cation transporter [Xanthomonadales bacterium]|nr:CorA family divalent cation transporter [Xanthomonadales bacterium]